MNKNIFTVALSVILLSSYWSSAAKADCSCSAKEEPRTISITGTGKMRAAPDKATIRFTIRNLNKAADKARIENNTISKQVLTAVRALEIPEKKIHLENLSISEEFEYNSKNGTNESKGFRAYRTFSVEVEKPDIGTKTLTEKISEVVEAVVSNGSNQLESVQYGLVNQDELSTQVLQTAIKNAKQKASDMLSSIGAELGKVRSVNESYSEPYVRRTFGAPKVMAMMAESSAVDSSQPESFSEGDLEINATVNVVFEIL